MTANSQLSGFSRAEIREVRERGSTGTRVLRNSMVRLVLRRLGLTVPLLFVVTALVFLLVSLTPGDAATAILGPSASAQSHARLRHEMGLDLPLYTQYWNWLEHALRGNLGASLFNGEPVTHAINSRLPVTLSLIIGSLVLSTILGVCLGVLSAARGGAFGRAVDAAALIGFALPSFWLGAILISLFAVKLHWLPAVGYVSLKDSSLQWLRSLLLPIIALSLHGVAGLAKQTREAMLDALGSEYIRMARANGIRARSILFRHALRNASIRVATVLGLKVVALLGGTVLVETVFALPGVGSLAVSSSVQHDLPMIEGIVVYYTLIIVFVNLAIDVAYTWLDPRVRTS